MGHLGDLDDWKATAKRCGVPYVHRTHVWTTASVVGTVAIAYRCDGGSDYVEAFVDDDGDRSLVAFEQGMYDHEQAGEDQR